MHLFSSYLRRLTTVVLVFLLMPSYSQEPIEYSKLVKCRQVFESLLTGELELQPHLYEDLVALKNRELEGLDHEGVIVWGEKDVNGILRKLNRYHGVDYKFSTLLPKYDKTQKLGPATVPIQDIRFAQVNCKNASDGGYTVVNNARAIKDGTLDYKKVFPKVQVWRDTEGRIWTLDHRRLAAMRLSGAVKEVDVEFVSEALVQVDRFKFATKSEGKSIFVTLDPVEGQPPLAIVILNDDITETLLGGTAGVNKILTHYPEAARTAWLAARDPKHFMRLESFAKDLDEVYSTFKDAAVSSFGVEYARFGKATGRAKQENSILSKLIREDYKAFQRGESGITDLKKALTAIQDGIGHRVTLTAGKNGLVSPQTVQGLVNQICKDIKSGLRINILENYRSSGTGLPYFSEGQIKQIVKADADFRAVVQKVKDAGENVTVPDPIVIVTGEPLERASGYTAVHLNVEYQSGVIGEIQIRGPAISEVAEIEHIFHDLRTGKLLSEAYKKNPKILKVSDIYQGLSAENKMKFGQYIRERFEYARLVETGQAKVPAPQLPEGLPQELSFEHLRPLFIK